MPDNEIFGSVEQKDSKSAPSAEKKITLDSILREYDAKKQAAEKKKADKDGAEERFEEFKRDLENYTDASSAQTDETISGDATDDSDMKIAADTRGTSSERTDDAVGVQEESADSDHKIDIMSEISRRFDHIAEANSSEEPADVPDTLPDAVSEEIEISDEQSEQDKNNSVRKNGIDDETLIKAFDGDGFDISGSVKAKKKKRRDTEEYETDTDYEEPAEGDKKPRRKRYDDNGERIKRDNPIFAPSDEYTQESDSEAILLKLRTKLLTACFSMIAVFVIMIACFYTELAPALNLPHFKMFEPGKTGVVFILFDLQLLFFAVIAKLNSISKGAVGLFSGHPSAEGVAFATVKAASLHALVSAFAASNATSVPLMCSAACFSVFVLSVRDFMQSRTEFVSFRIITSDNEKYAFKDLADDKENTPDEIIKFVPEGSNVLDIRKIGFAKNFFAKNAKTASSDTNIGVTVLISLLISLIAGVLFYIFNKGIYEAFCGVVSIFLASVQSGMMLATSYPEFVFADKASKRKCAYIGHDLCDEFEGVSVVSFKDTEVFSPDKIKVTNIRTYGDTRIDSVVVTMARVFGKVGGSLSSVFSNSISGISTDIGDICIIDVAPDGLWLKIDGENVYVGTLSYMNENNFDTAHEQSDDSFRMTSGGAILYLAYSDRVVAKFYIKYDINPAFEKVLRNLYTQGICARIKTLDPCINNDFIRACLRRPECLFSVVKVQTTEDFEKHEEEIDASLVSASNENSLIHSFLLIRKMTGAVKINNIIKIASVVVGLVLSALMLVGGSRMISPAMILMLQIFWVIPMIICTKLADK